MLKFQRYLSETRAKTVGSLLPISSDRKVVATWSLLMAILILLSFEVPQTYKILPGATLAWVAIAFAVGFTGSVGRHRKLRNYGFLATIAGVAAAVATDLGVFSLEEALLGFGLVIGVGLMVVGIDSEKALVPLGAYMLIGAVIQAFASPSIQFLVSLTWFMLGGAAFASFGYVKRSAFLHFSGLAFIFGVLGTYLFVGENYLIIAVVGILIILGVLLGSFTYMYHVLGRTPKVDEILTLAARALFTYGLRRPLDEYRVIAITIQGDIGTELVIDELLSKLGQKWHPIVVLGPTSPTEIKFRKGVELGWVASLTGVVEQGYKILSPSNPTEVNIFISEAMKATPANQSPIIIGDFMDNMIPLMKDESFFRYYSDLASRIKVLNQTAVFIVKSDIHSDITINIVKRFADVIIENREREIRGERIVREVRVSNKVDNFSTEWERIRT